VQKTHAPVNAEARGKLRALKAKLATLHRRIEAAIRKDAMHALVEEFAMKSGKGQQRALIKILRALGPGAHQHDIWATGALWVMFKPHKGGALISDDPSDAQDSISANFLLLGEWGENRLGAASGPWTLEFKEHALGRLITRDPGADPVKVMLAANRNILTADYRLSPMAYGKGDPFYLAAGDGAFVCNFAVAGDTQSDEPVFSVQASTWLHNDMLAENQIPIAPAPEGEQCGELILLPRPMRDVALRNGPPLHDEPPPGSETVFDESVGRWHIAVAAIGGKVSAMRFDPHQPGEADIDDPDAREIMRRLSAFMDTWKERVLH